MGVWVDDRVKKRSLTFQKNDKNEDTVTNLFSSPE